MSRSMESSYDDPDFVAGQVRAGQHREVIGGLWDEMGRLQLEFMRAQGLQPQHRLLDLGCGSLRAGIHFVRYLDAGRYYGLDHNQSLLDAGYGTELVPVEDSAIWRDLDTPEDYAALQELATASDGVSRHDGAELMEEEEHDADQTTDQ